jgi:hypothetical protein
MLIFRGILLIVNVVLWMIVHMCIVPLNLANPNARYDQYLKLNNNIIEYSIVYISFLLLMFLFYWGVYKDEKKHFVFFFLAILINLFLFYLFYSNFLDLANSVGHR